VHQEAQGDLQKRNTYNPSSHFTNVGSTKSKKNGKWKVLTNAQSGFAYRAKVKKKKDLGGHLQEGDLEGHHGPVI
jgi:hypothetical protein